MIKSYHNFFGDARGNILPFLVAPQDDDFSLVCEYSVGRASAVATSLLHE
ncbi:MAG: hypothetical protein F6K39_24115 [Okeania sp. SIO3B3]|nr:hypothetical protein [Okeania sp. SIO3B3]